MAMAAQCHLARSQGMCGSQTIFAIRILYPDMGMYCIYTQYVNISAHTHGNEMFMYKKCKAYGFRFFLFLYHSRAYASKPIVGCQIAPPSHKYITYNVTQADIAVAPAYRLSLIQHVLTTTHLRQRNFICAGARALVFGHGDGF